MRARGLYYTDHKKIFYPKNFGLGDLRDPAPTEDLDLARRKILANRILHGRTIIVMAADVTTGLHLFEPRVQIRGHRIEGMVAIEKHGVL